MGFFGSKTNAVSVEQSRLLKIIRIYRKSRDERRGHEGPGVGWCAVPQEAPPAPGGAPHPGRHPRAICGPGHDLKPESIRTLKRPVSGYLP